MNNTPVPPQILAVIAAAVSVTLGKNARIVNVSAHDGIPSYDEHALFWRLQGRNAIALSHKVR